MRPLVMFALCSLTLFATDSVLRGSDPVRYPWMDANEAVLRFVSSGDRVLMISAVRNSGQNPTVLLGGENGPVQKVEIPGRVLIPGIASFGSKAFLPWLNGATSGGLILDLNDGKVTPIPISTPVTASALGRDALAIATRTPAGVRVNWYDFVSSTWSEPVETGLNAGGQVLMSMGPGGDTLVLDAADLRAVRLRRGALVQDRPYELSGPETAVTREYARRRLRSQLQASIAHGLYRSANGNDLVIFAAVDERGVRLVEFDAAGNQAVTQSLAPSVSSGKGPRELRSLLASFDGKLLTVLDKNGSRHDFRRE
ncbi:MAG: hypothetical protein K2X35_00045 [Bryobacteraceae bacterium]|nr:hypothetical protein [Bryobacteraceae bacterium]